MVEDFLYIHLVDTIFMAELSSLDGHGYLTMGSG
jgi:hypothetical protein